MKFLYTIFTSPLGLPIEPIWEWLILFVVEGLAFSIAYKVSPGGQFGSLIHWIVRIIAFISIWAILYGVIYAIILLCQNWKIVVSVLGGVTFVGGVITIMVLSVKKKKLNDVKTDKNKTEVIDD